MLKVLIGDDDTDDVELFQEALYEVSPETEVKVATNGLEVLDELKSSDPRIVFLDINMPEMNGWDCLRIIKGDKILKKIPVIVFTTSSALQDMEIAFKMGALCFLTKPDRYDDLKAFLEEVVMVMTHGKPEDLKCSQWLKYKTPRS